VNAHPVFRAMMLTQARQNPYVAGKSALARQLSDVTGIPAVEWVQLDGRIARHSLTS
jgi:hypothetical protein